MARVKQKPNKTVPSPKKGKGKQAVAKKQTKRWRPGTVALREIRKYQKSTDLLVQKAPFRRLVREISDTTGETYHYTKDAMLALQEAAEHYLLSVPQGASVQSVFVPLVLDVTSRLA
ncbi:hypothetical protein WJX72_002521 [[Myrmecia] bisecta]|uniref:Core Histone H2A/H2B/H3 domain-containing protein n=1 Tax=[Myrmecia] bisecta TaxID=41462 RepID=A0AAW1Q0G4_9CHLO